MELGAVTEYIDVAQITLYVFWVFFFGLIFYLQMETRREGYPLESDTTGELDNPGPVFMPDPKTFKKPHGRGSVSYPNDVRETRKLKLERTGSWDGAPYEPTGNPMQDGVGPASYAMRPDVVDVTFDNKPRVVPMRSDKSFSVAAGDRDPRGYSVIGADGEKAGEVADIWVDRAEQIIRYYEVTTGSGAKAKNVLLPMTFCDVKPREGRVMVSAITAAQFTKVPETAKKTQVTLLEEDKIMGYYGGGLLYAHPKRQEPLL
ncbi:MAG: photosynthetic reaction center subunit H [Pseudomonadota bacterium]